MHRRNFAVTITRPDTKAFVRRKSHWDESGATRRRVALLVLSGHVPQDSLHTNSPSKVLRTVCSSAFSFSSCSFLSWSKNKPECLVNVMSLINVLKNIDTAVVSATSNLSHTHNAPLENDGTSFVLCEDRKNWTPCRQRPFQQRKDE